MSTALPGAPSRTSRRGVLRQILTVGLLGLLAAVIVGAVAVVNVSRMREANTQLATLEKLGDEVQDLRFGNSDTNGWQGFYAWDTRKLGPVEAVEGGPDTNREGFVEAAKATTALFDGIDTTAMTAEEKTLLTEMRTNWDAYLAGDDEAVAAFRTGTPAGLEKGTKIIDEGVCVTTYDAIDTAGRKLGDSVASRIEGQREIVADRARDTVAAVVLTLLLFTALAIFAAVRVATRLIRRIRAAQTSIEALGIGDLTVPCESGTSDEIDAIAAAIERARVSMRDVIAAVQDASTRVGESSSGLSAVADRLGTSSNTTRRRLEEIAGSTTEVTHSVTPSPPQPRR
ncbi:methyl-accepting chemotaxis protein [Mobilicoccus pelagius]|uniref:Putative methyl-accepting chemotaxis protein n=1 Tax=Mobilicoccus pelagius NBRC 104925 TaxID=1089455 RepID=H5UUW1_9MICO|nr:methyl-accepting chemotaxis protein [Mobilicoccus pelagius]GAB49519.1 putative methyl-accepting chemotaxis protein [Mobilicoccus pelagius NBRC 104925]